MITTGIIKQINISDSGLQNNKYKVILSIFQTPGDTIEDHYTFTATASSTGGLYASYNVGDKVYVGFINNEYANPVILGRIYQGLTNENRTFAYLNSLQVADKVTLPDTTMIGNYNVASELKSANLVLHNNYKDAYLHTNAETGELEWTQQGYLHVIQLSNSNTEYACDITYTLIADKREIEDVNSNMFIVALYQKKYKLLNVCGYYQKSTVIGVSSKGYVYLNLMDDAGTVSQTNYSTLITSGAKAVDKVYEL